MASKTSIATNLIATVVLSLLCSPPANAGSKLTLVWQIETPMSQPMAISPDIFGRPFIYVAHKSGGLTVIDVSLKQPAVVANLSRRRLSDMDVMNLSQKDHYLYLSLGDFFGRNAHAGLAVISVENPRRPRRLAVWKSPSKMQGSAIVAVQEPLAFLGAMQHGVMVFDVSNFREIEHLATYQPDVDFPRPNPGKTAHPNARGMTVRGRWLYVAYDAGGLRVIDLQDPRHPVEASRYINQSMINNAQAYNNIAIYGGRAYVTLDYAGLEILDIRNPRDIHQIGWWNPWKADSLTNLWFNSHGHTNQLVFDKKRKAVMVSAGDSELIAVDVSNSAHPRMLAQFGRPGNLFGCWGVAQDDSMIYLAYIKTPVPFRGTWSGIKAVRIRP